MEPIQINIRIVRIETDALVQGDAVDWDQGDWAQARKAHACRQWVTRWTSQVSESSKNAKAQRESTICAEAKTTKEAVRALAMAFDASAESSRERLRARAEKWFIMRLASRCPNPCENDVSAGGVSVAYGVYSSKSSKSVLLPGGPGGGSSSSLVSATKSGMSGSAGSPSSL